MGLPSAADIIALVKTGATIEAQEKIMELRTDALDKQEVILELRERIATLEAEIKLLKAGESCPKCHSEFWKLQGSCPDPTFGRLGVLLRSYKCEGCGYSEAQQFDPCRN